MAIAKKKETVRKKAAPKKPTVDAVVVAEATPAPAAGPAREFTIGERRYILEHPPTHAAALSCIFLRDDDNVLGMMGALVLTQPLLAKAVGHGHNIPQSAGRAMDYLLGKGWTMADCMRSGAVAFSFMASTLPTATEVDDAANFTGAKPGSTVY